MLDCHFPPFPDKSLLVIHFLARGYPSNHNCGNAGTQCEMEHLLGITDTIHVLLIVE